MLDEVTQRVWLDELELKRMPPLQMRVLLSLYRHRKEPVCTYSWLEQEAWDAPEGTVGHQAIAACVTRLRQQLGQKNPYEGYIETVEGKGYRLHTEGFSSQS